MKTEQLFKQMREAPVEIPREKIEQFVLANVAAGIATNATVSKSALKFHLNTIIVMTSSATALAIAGFLFFGNSHAEKPVFTQNTPVSVAPAAIQDDKPEIPATTLPLDTPQTSHPSVVTGTSSSFSSSSSSSSSFSSSPGKNIAVSVNSNNNAVDVNVSVSDSSYNYSYGNTAASKNKAKAKGDDEMLANIISAGDTGAWDDSYAAAYAYATGAGGENASSDNALTFASTGSGNSSAYVNGGDPDTNICIKGPFIKGPCIKGPSICCEKNDSLVPTIEKALLKDGLITDRKNYTFAFTGKKLKINGTEQPAETWKKYKEIIENSSDYKVNKRFELVISVSGKNQTMSINVNN